ncbi:ATP-binding protein [Archangium sp.]|uniref:ATP-binding protein n=1 Tax=Archangium sp. TaxID=1872627 RepID=UPI00286BC1E5|nr:ATP-binding protein [Archangium sp.]
MSVQGVSAHASPELPYRELFLHIAEQSSDAVFTKDLQGRYTFINSAGARYLGRSVEEVLGRKDDELVPMEEAQATMEFDRQVLLAGRMLHSEMSERMAGAQREWLSTKGVLRDQGGQVMGLFGIARDLSAHLRGEEAQRRNEALFRLAVSGSFDAFFILRGEDEGLRVLHLNTHAESLLGCRAREAEGHLLSEFPHAAFIAPAASCEAFWRTGRPQDEEVLQELPGGARRWLRRELRAVGDCLAVTVRDITQQRESEARLRLNERMASIGMLAAGVAHEINNPLAFVSGNLGFIQGELRRPEPLEELRGELLEAVTEAREGAERMRLIVQSLQSLSRGDPVASQPLELHEVLETSIHLVQGKVCSRARLVRDYGELPQVQGNAVQLAQVFVNLLVNAAQAMPASGGEIQLTTRVHDDARVRVEVRDTGCGIPPESLERIFEPFFTTKPVGEGTGLGLPISHGIIRALGGELSVESTVGEGTTFRILLPTVAEHLPEAPRPYHAAAFAVSPPSF